MFDSYTTTVCTSITGGLERLIAWKDERGSVEGRTENMEETDTPTGGDGEEEKEGDDNEDNKEEEVKNAKDTEKDSEHTT